MRVHCLAHDHSKTIVESGTQPLYDPEFHDLEANAFPSNSYMPVVITISEAINDRIINSY